MATVPPEASSPQSHSNPNVSPEPMLLDDPDADIILSSRDLKEFRVLKLYIVGISPVLGALIRVSTADSIDSSTSTRTEVLPHIRLSESSDILSSLLSFVLPVPPTLPPTAQQVMELLSVAQKYKMNSTLAHIRGAVASQDPPFIRPETAFHIYSLALRYGLRQEVARAARMALTFPMTIQGLEDKLDTMPGAHLHLLWKHYQSVRINLKSDLTAFRTQEAHSARAGLTLTCGNTTSSGIPNWLDSYIASIGEDPALFSLFEFHMCSTRHLLGCNWCRNKTSETICALWRALTTAVNNSMTNGEENLLQVMEGKAEFLSHPNSSRSASPSPEPRNAYLDPPHADIIVQSSDFVNFRVDKAILSMSSPFFEDMFSLPQPPNDEVIDGLPVVRLSEDAEILNSLLTALYPIVPVVPESHHRILQVLVASQKYDMAGVQSSIRAEIESWGPITLTGTEAFRAYAISSSAKLLPETEIFARHTLGFTMTLEYLSDELPFFAGWALRDLVRYRKRCRDGLVPTLQSFLDSNAAPSNIWVVCTAERFHTYDKNVVFPRWLQDFLSLHIKKLQDSFTDPLLMPSSIRGAYLAALNTHISSKDCVPCMKVHALKGETFCAELESKLAQALDKESVMA